MLERKEKGRLTQKEACLFASLLDSGEYRNSAQGLLTLSAPQKRFVNKGGAGKKRAVYSYTPKENAALKILSYLCYRYDGQMPDNLYSFRKNSSPHKAVRRLTGVPNIRRMYAYKLDVRDYFNSIPPDRLLAKLKPLLMDDEPLFKLFSNMLLAPGALLNGEFIKESHGVLAGVPTSAFLANVYLAPLDRHFEQARVPYARYSDDIIVFAADEQELKAHRAYIDAYLSENGLAVNPDKVQQSAPGEEWSYLGFSYKNGVIDLSKNTKDKLKAKVRRKARALYRWRRKKGASPEQAMKAFARTLNKKLYEETDEERRFTWSRWFFPLLTTAESLKELDSYILQYMRYIATGRFSNANYRVRYPALKELGFMPLVARFYAQKAEEPHKI